MSWEVLQRLRAAQIILRPLSFLYGLLVLAKVRAYARGQLKPRRLRGAVVSVGNLTVGGVGKTPMVLWLAQRFFAQGKRVAVLSRGYRGARGTSDEVELLRTRLGESVTVAAGADRFAAGRALEEHAAVDVFVLDDGFQHMQLARDVDILLMDASRPLANERLLPAGLLREPVSAMSRADILVFTRADAQPGVNAALSRLSEYPVFSATTKLLGFRDLRGDGKRSLLDLRQIGEGPFLAFCGLGNPQQYFSDLESWGVVVQARKAFPDHHRYTAADVALIERAAEQCGARALMTTEKDAQNMDRALPRRVPMYAAVIDMEITHDEDFLALIEARIAQHAGAAS